MLTIREKQLSILRRSMRPATCRRIAAHLRAEHAEATAALSETDLDARVSAGAARAEQYGLVNERDLAWFVAAQLEVSPHFDEQPRIRALLGDAATPPGERIRRLLAETTAEDWEDAAR